MYGLRRWAGRHVLGLLLARAGVDVIWRGYRRGGWAPTAFLQALQRAIHACVVAVAMTGADPAPPRAVQLVGGSRPLRRVLGYLVAIGPLPEHASGYARRGG